MHRIKKQLLRRISFIAAVILAASLLPVSAMAVEEYGYNEATASGRPYNGTNYVAITDMIFSGVFVTDDVSADGDGYLSSPNAGTYTTVNGTHFVLKGADRDWYQVDYDAVYTDIPLKEPVVITKAEPILTITAERVVEEGAAFTVTVSIDNHFSYMDGLPEASQMMISVDHAVQKPGTTVERVDNQYTATFIATDDQAVKQMTVSANVSEQAINYRQLATPVQQTVQVQHPVSFSAVDAAIAKAEALDPSLFQDFSAVEKAIKAVDRDSQDQEAINAMARAIEEALAQLTYKAADYSAVEAAVNRAKALKAEEYQDFSAVEAALQAVVYGLDIRSQEEVDRMAQAIEAAIAGLEQATSTTTSTETATQTTTTTTSTTTAVSPKTSDPANIGLYALLLAVAGVGAVAMMAARRQSRRHTR